MRSWSSASVTGSTVRSVHRAGDGHAFNDNSCLGQGCVRARMDPMSSWHDVRSAAPDLATRVQQRFEAHRHNLLATLRRDGSPRMTGIETTFASDLWLGMMPASLKARDLQRDPRLALHAAPIDLELADGDAKLSGCASEITDDAEKAAFVAALEAAGKEAPPPGPFHLFRVDVTEMSIVRVEGDHLVIDIWAEGAEPRRVERE